MKDAHGREMFLTVEAEAVAQTLYAMGADFTRGHADLHGQAHAMADNITTSGNRRWIAETYLHPLGLQEVVDAHPDVTDAVALEALLFAHLAGQDPTALGRLTHHFLMPCPVFDVQPRFDDTGQAIKAKIMDLLTSGVVQRVLWVEGKIARWHVEVTALTENKVTVEV